MTYARVRGRGAPAGGRLAGGGLAKGEVVAVMAPNCPEYGVSSTPSRWPAVSSPRSTRRTRRAKSTTSSSTPAPTRLVTSRVPRDGRRRRSRTRQSKRCTSSAKPTATRRSPRSMRAPLAEQVPVDLDDVVVLPVLLGDDRPGEGRDAHAPQPRREHRADPRHASRCKRTTPSSQCCRSSTSTACRCS